MREVSRDPWCKHRTAFDDKTFPVCKAGVNYHEFKVAGEYGKYYGDQMPCLGRSVTDAKTRCQKFENWTREEIDARRRKVEATIDRIRTHCWVSGPFADDGCPTTCMLPDMHKGPHEWTRDDNITISFASRKDGHD